MLAITTFTLLTTLAAGPLAFADSAVANGHVYRYRVRHMNAGATGDWSAGVSGFWFENGERAYPVSEITVAGNLIDIFLRLVPGADLERRSSLDTPSVLIDDLLRLSRVSRTELNYQRVDLSAIARACWMSGYIL